MPTINWAEVQKQPWPATKAVSSGLLQVLSVVISRLCRPWEKHVLSLRNAVARELLGAIFVHCPTVFYSGPKSTSIMAVAETHFEAFIIPNINKLKLPEVDAVILFAHGGGMISGHPLQYRDDYKRWSQWAAGHGKKVHFLAVKYRKAAKGQIRSLERVYEQAANVKTALSTQSRWPSQRDPVVAAYEWLLTCGVPASKIIFAGDSAGGNLVLLTLLHLRDQTAKTQLPAAVVLMSPWVDMTGAQTINSPLSGNDFLLQYDRGASLMNSMLRPENTPADTPEISALLHQDLGRLPPQLVMYSTTELLTSDSQRWIAQSISAGNVVEEFKANGELHTFSCGWPMTDRKMQDRCDEVFGRFILKSVEEV